MPASFYVAAILVAKVDSGTPNWIISGLAGGAPLAFGAGRNVVLGPLLLYPGEQLNIAVNGADANTKVLGQFVGFQGESVEEIAESLTQLPTGFNSRSIVDVNPVVRISANSAAGQPVVSVADLTPFHVGQAVNVVQPTLATSTGTIQSITANDASGTDPSGQLTLNANLLASYTTAGSVMVILTSLSNIAQVNGIPLVASNTFQSGNYALPLGTRWAVQSASPFAIGTYNFDVPSLGTLGFFNASASAGATLTPAGMIASGTGKGLLYISAVSGAGTVTFSLLERDDVNGIVSGAILSSAALSAPTQTALRVAPGIAVIANGTTNDLLSPTPRVQVVVAGGAMNFAFTLDLL